MQTQRGQFPIPILWVYVFSYCSIGILCVLGYSFRNEIPIHHPILIIPAGVLAVIAVVFLTLHRLGLFAESRGWIYYRQPKTGGLKAGVALDLEILFSARPQSQVENLRKAREAHNESAHQDGDSDIPPEKVSLHHE